MAEVPSHVGSFIWLVATDEGTDGVIEAPDVFDMPVIKVFYDYVTNRLVILEDDDSRHEIPTIATGDTYPEQNAVVVIDVGGNLSTTLNPSVLNPFIAANDILATPIRWPQPTGSPAFKVGQVMAVDSVSTESPPGGGSMDRAELGWNTTAIRLASVAGVNLNTTTKTDLFTPPSGSIVIVTQVLMRLPSDDIINAQWSFGSDADATDWLPNDSYPEFVVPGFAASKLFTIRGPMDGATYTTDSQPFGIKCNVVEGSARTITIDVFGYYLQ